jgi:hypothetical protein
MAAKTLKRNGSNIYIYGAGMAGALLQMKKTKKREKSCGLPRKMFFLKIRFI